MNLLNDSLLMEMERQRRLAHIDREWQVVELERSQGKRPFFPYLQNTLKLLGQIRRIRIQVTFETVTPCPETVP